MKSELTSSLSNKAAILTMKMMMSRAQPQVTRRVRLTTLRPFSESSLQA